MCPYISIIWVMWVHLRHTETPQQWCIHQAKSSKLQGNKISLKLCEHKKKKSFCSTNEMWVLWKGEQFLFYIKGDLICSFTAIYFILYILFYSYWARLYILDGCGHHDTISCFAKSHFWNLKLGVSSVADAHLTDTAGFLGLRLINEKFWHPHCFMTLWDTTKSNHLQN